MATPPRVPEDALVATLRLIRRRHEKAGDRTWGMITRDVRATLDYLAGYRGPEHVRRADVMDCLTLHTVLWWEDRRRERDTLRAAIALGWPLRQIGAQVGITSRQGARDRLDRLEALLVNDRPGNRPDEKLTREARRAAVLDDATRDVWDVWIGRHTGELATVAAMLTAVADLYQPAEREWLDELAADLAGGQWSAGTLTVLGLAAAEIRGHLAETGLAPDSPLYAALLQADRLRALFAQIGQ